MILSFEVCILTTTTMSASVVGAGVSATDKQRGETRGVGKHKRERNGKYENWRTLKAGRGGVYLRRSERSDKWRGGAFVRSRRLCGWLVSASLPFCVSFPLFLFTRLFYRPVISHYIKYIYNVNTNHNNNSYFLFIDY